MNNDLKNFLLPVLFVATTVTAGSIVFDSEAFAKEIKAPQASSDVLGPVDLSATTTVQSAPLRAETVLLQKQSDTAAADAAKAALAVKNATTEAERIAAAKATASALAAKAAVDAEAQRQAAANAAAQVEAARQARLQADAQAAANAAAVQAQSQRRVRSSRAS